jgi:hypothetical protein
VAVYTIPIAIHNFKHFYFISSQEIPENGADVAHLKQLHGPILLSGTDLRYMYNKTWEFLKHHWVATWTQRTDPKEKHIGSLNVTHNLELFGSIFPGLEFHVEARQVCYFVIQTKYSICFPLGIHSQMAYREQIPSTKRGHLI